MFKAILMSLCLMGSIASAKETLMDALEHAYFGDWVFGYATCFSNHRSALEQRLINDMIIMYANYKCGMDEGVFSTLELLDQDIEGWIKSRKELKEGPRIDTLR